MEKGAYSRWRSELERWLKQADPGQFEIQAAGQTRGAGGLIIQILQESRGIIKGINQTLDHGQTADRNKYDFLASRLEDILSLESFSLAEYTYHLALEQKPGIRLWLEQGQAGAQVTLILFEDVVKWRVDDQGRKISTELITLTLDGPQPFGKVHQKAGGYIREDSDWRDMLAQALCLPVLIFQQP